MASLMSLMGCTTPVSLLANMTVTRQVSVRRAADTEETSTEPVDCDTGRIVKSRNWKFFFGFTSQMISQFQSNKMLINSQSTNLLSPPCSIVWEADQRQDALCSSWWRGATSEQGSFRRSTFCTRICMIQWRRIMRSDSTKRSIVMRIHYVVNPG